MRILFCNYEYPPLGGGGGVVNAALARELARRHDVMVLTSRGPGLAAVSREAGVTVVRAPVVMRHQRAVASFTSMLAYVINGTFVGRALGARRRFDVINTHFALPTGPVGDAVSRFTGVPNVLSVHGGDLYDPSKRSSAHRHAPLRMAVRRLARRADAVVAQSGDTAENLRRYYAPELRPHVIPLGIAVPPPVDPQRSAFGFARDDVLLVSVGRLVARKRVDQLLRALAEIRDPGIKLLLIGEGPLERELRETADQLGLQGRVFFMGAVDEVTKHELLTVSDLYVSTSEHEGFGLVFLEAMANGLPVVSYDRGGHRDFLHHGRTGYLAPLNNLDAFVDCCRALIGDSMRRAAIGRYNRGLAADYFIDACARRYEALFESVIAEHAQRRRVIKSMSAPRIAKEVK